MIYAVALLGALITVSGAQAQTQRFQR